VVHPRIRVVLVVLVVLQHLLDLHLFLVAANRLLFMARQHPLTLASLTRHQQPTLILEWVVQLLLLEEGRRTLTLGEGNLVLTQAHNHHTLLAVAEHHPHTLVVAVVVQRPLTWVEVELLLHSDMLEASNHLLLTLDRHHPLCLLLAVHQHQAVILLLHTLEVRLLVH